MAVVENEECVGCGWSFDDGGERWPVVFFNDETKEDDTQSICLPCAHASHSWRGGRMLGNAMAHVSNCTNLILAAIDAAREGGEGK